MQTKYVHSSFQKYFSNQCSQTLISELWAFLVIKQQRWLSLFVGIHRCLPMVRTMRSLWHQNAENHWCKLKKGTNVIIKTDSKPPITGWKKMPLNIIQWIGIMFTSWLGYTSSSDQMASKKKLATRQVLIWGLSTLLCGPEMRTMYSRCEKNSLTVSIFVAFAR